MQIRLTFFCTLKGFERTYISLYKPGLKWENPPGLEKEREEGKCNLWWVVHMYSTGQYVTYYSEALVPHTDPQPFLAVHVLLMYGGGGHWLLSKVPF